MPPVPAAPPVRAAEETPRLVRVTVALDTDRAVGQEGHFLDRVESTAPSARCHGVFAELVARDAASQMLGGHDAPFTIARDVAKGVESEEQAMLLRLLRCVEMQGFLFWEPMPANEVEAVLSRRVTH